MPRKSPGGPRGAVLSVRIPEKTRYGLQLMSRLYREAIPDIVIRAVNDAFTSENGGLFIDVKGDDMPRNLLAMTWAERESDRLANLALRYPDLLTGREQRLWTLVKATAKYWAPPTLVMTSKAEAEASIANWDESSLLRDVLAEDWAALTAAAPTQVL